MSALSITEGERALKILAVDSSAKSASAAICDDETLVSEAFVNIGLTHSETLMPMIDSVLKNSKTDISEIDAFCVTAGPGSFTGVRIGVAAVKGLAHPQKKPCAGVSTLEAMAHCARDFDGIICASMDARCSQVYTAVFECRKKEIKRLTKDIAISLTELYNILLKYDDNILFVGDGAELCFSTFGDKLNSAVLASGLLRYQRAYGAVLAALAAGEGAFMPPELLSPVYIRPPQAERELKKKKENG